MTKVSFSEKLSRVLSSINDLSTLPSVADNLTQLIENPKTSAVTVSDSIRMDPALTSKVLKLVNSAFYGFPRKINTLSQAVVILGFNNIKNIILTASIFNIFSSSKTSKLFNIEKFWEHSMGCGVISKIMTKTLGIKKHEEAFIGGLLHDIGKLLLCQCLMEEFGEIVEMVKEKDILFIDAEREVLGLDHCFIGKKLGEHWNLPAVLEEVIEFHHDPKSATDNTRLASIVHLADILSRALDIGSGGDDKIPVIDESTMELLEIDLSFIEKLLPEIEEEMAKARELLTMIH